MGRTYQLQILAPDIAGYNMLPPFFFLSLVRESQMVPVQLYPYSASWPPPYNSKTQNITRKHQRPLTISRSLVPVHMRVID